MNKRQINSCVLKSLLVSWVWSAGVWADDPGGYTKNYYLQRTLEFRAMSAWIALPPGITFGTDRSKVRFSPAEVRIWHKDRWNRRITQGSEEGFNAVIWSGAHYLFWSGNHELWGGRHALIRHEEFPEARELAPDENERIIADVNWLFSRAKQLGMKNLLYTLTIFVSPAFAKAHGLDKPMPVSPTVSRFHNEPYAGQRAPQTGVRNELTRAYTKAVFAEFLKTYEDLDGFYTPVGEPVPGNRSTWFKEAIVPGLKRSGRKPLMIAHQWQVPLEDYLENIAPKEIYDNTWLGFHGWNSEGLTDAQPYPGLVEWAEKTGLPTVVTLYPTNMRSLLFNSPEFAYEIIKEMKRIDNIVGFLYWDWPDAKLADLFRKALVYYAAHGEAYSDEPWLRMLETQFGDRRAAEHLLKAYDISGRILPELGALVYAPSVAPLKELQMPYACFTDDHPCRWMTSPARGRRLVPIALYAKFVAENPALYKQTNGNSPNQPPYRQEAIWQVEGGSVYETIPPDHMREITLMSRHALQEAEAGLKFVKNNVEQAENMHAFIKAYALLAPYYQRKVTAATAALVYAHSHRPMDRAEAESLADEALQAYLKAAQFMQETLDPIRIKMVGSPLEQLGGGGIANLIELEKKDRARLSEIFNWPE